MNEVIFILHTFTTIFLGIGALKLGQQALIALVCLLGVLSNIFIAKQVTLFGCAVTCSDAYAVGSILCLNFLQEYFGREKVPQAIWASFFCLMVFLIMSQLHLWYLPNHFDTAQPHYQMLLSIMPRITLASLTSYLTVQVMDMCMFAWLQRLLHGKFFTLRITLSLILSQTLDTVFFSFLGLYGIVGSVLQVIIVSLAVKLLIIALSTPLISLTKRVIKTNPTFPGNRCSCHSCCNQDNKP